MATEKNHILEHIGFTDSKGSQLYQLHTKGKDTKPSKIWKLKNTSSECHLLPNYCQTDLGRRHEQNCSVCSAGRVCW